MEVSTKKSRQARRNAKKRLIHRLESRQEELGKSVNGEHFRKQLQGLPPEQAAEIAHSLLTDTQQALLEKYRKDLRGIAHRLATGTAWDYLERYGAEAEEWGLGEVLRALVWESAGQFCDRRTLRVTARYSPR